MPPSPETPPEAPPEPAAAEPIPPLPGKRNLRLHDPSPILRCNDEYWCFSTGRGVPSHRSTDLRTWRPEPAVFPEPPAWVAEAVPENREGSDFWAPDVVHLDGRYLLYYSVSSWGRNNSAIALATNATLDPDDPAYRWEDRGIVIRSTPADDFNAIDPAVTLDAEGRLWMAFGSFWSGIRLVELDRATGRRIAPDSPVHALAWNEQIEAPFLHRRDGFYYLLVNFGWCCRGAESTYSIRVGRSRQITGPYLDRDGRDMLHGGGTLLLETQGPLVGPGQSSLLHADGRDWLACHVYDADDTGRAALMLRPITWDANGWPAVVAPPE